MFARTPRLTLRPPWPEDAPALTRAIAHESVAMKLARLPWPYTEADAAEWLAFPRTSTDATCLILSHDDAYPTVIGAMSIEARFDGHELGYWLTPDAWGRGYATEAGEAMLGMARHALGLKRLQSGYFLDNPASGKVLAKLGFERTGEEMRHSVARGHAVPCATLELDLAIAARTPVFSLAA
ncbi:GNAT family N-acetyltransferase [Sphingomonas glacialis]|uniref:N-acetyltransferase n=1 Tax=Sphingomonas glacialis TaxID=658225 RepID=A0A502FZL3_9SPHN|nr:GNAT family N-acetyltransferase [Sphingomonas glacialis]TPG54955.1 N-acetyltransferase [Sphingomonas glacialis]